MRETTLTELQRLTAETGADAAFHMDEDAFRGFYDRTSRTLWAYLSRVTGDRQLADDLLQETYYRFLRAAADYESEAHRRNSLFHIATNLVRDARRRTAPMQLFESANIAALQVDDDLAQRTERRTDLERAMAHLTPRDRMMLWLAYAQGESHRDIATALGLKTGSVKLLLFRARRKLASLLRGARS
jgi:RNA polymerase sigma-70 factor (ECF subfamily)